VVSGDFRGFSLHHESFSAQLPGFLRGRNDTMHFTGDFFRTSFFRFGVALSLAVTILASRPAEAGDMSRSAGAGSGQFIVACENGANYVLRSGRTTISGDVVTGRFFLSPRRSVHVRLIPMGDGYRYAGRGLWLDGIRDQAFLFLRKNSPIACHVGAAV
jgi:hypothetical protein